MPQSLLDRQLARVRRRLFLTSLLSLISWGWVVALGLGAAWSFAQPLVWASARQRVKV